MVDFKQYLTKRHIILALVLIAIIAVVFYLEATKSETSQQTISADAGQIDTLAPELTGNQGWINSDPLTIKELTEQGNVVLVDFWTYTCINCIRTLPYLAEWHKKYADKGLVILGVHTPEFDFEKKLENVQVAAEKHDLRYPIVQDNNYATWRAYNNRYWPAKYLIDKNGVIRYTHFGEGKYAETEEMIQELLAETGQNVANLETVQDPTRNSQPRTPELYLGYKFALPRGQNIGNQGGLQTNEEYTYTLPEDGKLLLNTIYLNNAWKSNPDNLEAVEDGSTILLAFTGSEVNFVADGNAEVEVIINGRYISEEQAGNDVEVMSEKSVVNVKEPRLYNIVKGEHGQYLLTITSNNPDFRISAFTFG